MCRSIKTLRRPDEAATTGELEAAARQFVRKISGYREPSARNAEAFEAAIADIAAVSRPAPRSRSVSRSRSGRTDGPRPASRRSVRTSRRGTRHRRLTRGRRHWHPSGPYAEVPTPCRLVAIRPTTTSSWPSAPRWCDRIGYDAALRFSTVAEEHLATRERVGVYDVYHQGALDLKGPDAEALLTQLLVNDPARLDDGGVLYSSLCNEAGGMVDDLTVYRLAGDHWWLCPTPSRVDIVDAWIRDHTDGQRAVPDQHRVGDGVPFRSRVRGRARRSPR